MNKVYWGDCRDSLRQMKEEGIKVQMCVTSPPYYGLRDYGTGTWIGGDKDCSHKRDSKHSDKTITGHANKDLTVGDAIYKTICPKCGAERKDLQIGLEETPQQFINNLVEVFACVWDVLADDGTLWVNLGDSYYNYRPGKGQALNKQTVSNNNQDLPQTCARRGNKLEGYKEKDLMGMPWRLAFALQDFGWYLRQDIIWHKPNPMPESIKDRCTKSHEYIFLLSKKPQYYFDHLAIQEPAQYWGERDRTNGKYHNEGSGLTPHTGLTGKKKDKRAGEGRIAYEGKRTENNTSGGQESFVHIEEFRNKRDVWTVTTKPYSGSHFAVFPTDLIEPCILAGSSSKGHCPKCFFRWKQIKIDTGKRKEGEIYTGQATKNYDDNKAQNPSDTKRRILESMSKVYDYKWVADCECGLESVPDIVLDPFFGSGTTGQVSQQLGRKWIGCELNKDYEALQNERISQQGFEFN